jgi:hypothetical protein
MEPFAPPSGPLTWIETLARLPIATVVLAMAVCTVIRLASSRRCRTAPHGL